MPKPKTLGKSPKNSEQLSLFELVKQSSNDGEPLPGSMDLDSALRGAITQSIKHSCYSRAEIAAKMSDLTGQYISKEMLNSWTTETKKGHRFPAIYLPALVYVTDNPGLFRLLAQPARLFVVESPDAVRSELAKIDEQINKLKNKKIKRRAYLAGLEGKG